MWGIVPVAGEGSRLRDVTRGAPKCLVEVGDRPLLFHLLDQLTTVCDDICLVVPPARTPFDEALEAYGITATVVVQPEPTGLADAVARAAQAVEGRALVTMGDGFYSGSLSMDLGPLPDGGAALLVEPCETPPDEPAGWVSADADGWAVRVWKGVRDDPDAHRIAGGFVLGPKFLAKLAVTRGDELFETLIDRSISEGERYRLLSVTGDRWNVNTPEQLQALRTWYDANVARHSRPAEG